MRTLSTICKCRGTQFTTLSKVQQAQADDGTQVTDISTQSAALVMWKMPGLEGCVDLTEKMVNESIANLGSCVCVLTGRGGKGGQYAGTATHSWS